MSDNRQRSVLFNKPDSVDAIGRLYQAVIANQRLSADFKKDWGTDDLAGERTAPGREEVDANSSDDLLDRQPFPGLPAVVGVSAFEGH